MRGTFNSINNPNLTKFRVSALLKQPKNLSLAFLIYFKFINMFYLLVCLWHSSNIERREYKLNVND